MEATDLKRKLAQARASGHRTYPQALRDAAVRYAAQRRAERVRRDKIAAELGMNVATLAYWCAPARRRPGITPVTIVAQGETTRDVVIECGPLRVRGLDVAA